MSSKRRNSLLLASLFLILAGGFFFNNYLFKAPTPIEQQKIVFADVSSKFNSVIASNASEWQNAIVEISGTVTSVDDKGLTLDKTIYCQFKYADQVNERMLNNFLNIKGRFIGYDDLLEESKLDQCILTP